VVSARCLLWHARHDQGYHSQGPDAINQYSTISRPMNTLQVYGRLSTPIWAVVSTDGCSLRIHTEPQYRIFSVQMQTYRYFKTVFVRSEAGRGSARGNSGGVDTAPVLVRAVCHCPKAACTTRRGVLPIYTTRKGKISTKALLSTLSRISGAWRPSTRTAMKASRAILWLTLASVAVTVLATDPAPADVAAEVQKKSRDHKYSADK
jgi:hypothetical protein